MEDDKAQSEQAARLVRRAISRDEPLFVSDVVLCETVWVLLAAYRVSKRETCETLSQLLKAKHLGFGNVDSLTRALEAFFAGKGDFADYVVREHARAAGCEQVATFDRALLKEKGFVAP